MTSCRSGVHLPAFAEAADVRASAARHVLTTERRQFAVAQTCLNRHQKQRPVPVTDPCAGIGGCHGGSGLFLGEKLDRTVFTALRWDRKNALTLQTQCRFADRDESKEGVHGCQAGIACPHGVSPALFEISKKLLDERCVKLFHLQLCRCVPNMLRGEGQ